MRQNGKAIVMDVALRRDPIRRRAGLERFADNAELLLDALATTTFSIRDDLSQANSTDRFRTSQLTRERPITQRRTGSDRPESRPNLALKGRASGRHGNGVVGEEIA